MAQGKEKLRAELLSLGQGIIVEELSKILSFRQGIEELAKLFPDIASVDDIEDFLNTAVIPAELNKGRPDTMYRMEEYIKSLDDLADCYNLRCGWIINGLHQIVRNIINREIETPISTIYMRLGIDRFKLDIPVYADTRKEDIERLVDEEWGRIKSRHPELGLRQRKPNEFYRHVGWLCRRLFFGETGSTIETGLALNEEITSDYIDLIIRKTAKLLYIKLPRGRPCTSKKR